MGTGRFDLCPNGEYAYWIERGDRGTSIRRARPGASGDEILTCLDKETLRRLLVWADDESTVSTVFTGPMSHEIRKHARELGTTEEMYVWNAVKLFTAVGEGP